MTTTTTTTTTTATATTATTMTVTHTDTAPLLWFAGPVGFVEVPLDGTADQRLDRLWEAFDAIGADVSPEQRLGTAVNAELLLQAQLEQGLVHLANCFYRTDGGEVMHAVFAVSVAPAETGGPLTFAARTAEQWAAARPAAEIGVLDLPCGRAVVATEDRTVTVPGQLYGLEQASESRFRQIEAAIAHPDGVHLVRVVLSTEYLEHWSDWAVVMGAALRGLSFRDPLTAVRERPVAQLPAGVEDRIRQAFG
ncbi:hypothetical protein [Kitasatospora viridis]|uniref:Uncharacterized protein n=1 Tax=Kitasatospora viridis TaxID=281105 RepID=A0A561UMK8_9ACTN|nr:hypothetical protein [Kitasatospora viridis]TWG00605.1 hypothetical protein FHX73_114485 [Kitasatospora viridis]